ncbi:MAG: LON peptidase substrate-binding domain-containing protein, partial [Chloroflexota bacterium]
MPRKRTGRLASKVSAELPVLPIRETVLFPHMMTPLFVDRDRSLRAIEEAMAQGTTVLIVSQKNADIQRPRKEDLYEVGTEAVIGRVLKMPEGTTSVLVQGQKRVKVLELTMDEPYLSALVAPLEEKILDPEPGGYTVEALMRAVLVLFEKCVRLSHTLPDDAYVAALNVDEPGWLADLVASTIDLPLEERQALLEMLDPVARLQKISILLAKEVDVLELENKIHAQVQNEVDKSQREYFLREQIKAIQHELGEGDIITREVVELKAKVAASGMPSEVAKKVESEL